MGAVPGFCGANRSHFMARKRGTAPDGTGDSPSLW